MNRRSFLSSLLAIPVVAKLVNPPRALIDMFPTGIHCEWQPVADIPLTTPQLYKMPRGLAYIVNNDTQIFQQWIGGDPQDDLHSFLAEPRE